MNLTKERWKEISRAVFDYYVKKRFIEQNFIVTAMGFNYQQLIAFAKLAKCDSASLILSLTSSIGRIGNRPLMQQQPEKDERETIMAVIRFHIEGVNIPLKKYRRDFGNMTSEINCFNRELKLKNHELKEFVYPIYRKIFEEIFQIMPAVISVEA